MSLAQFAPNSLLVGRVSDLAALISAPVIDWFQQPGSRVVVLPDSATAEDVRIVVASLSGPQGTPTGAPPG